MRPLARVFPALVVCASAHAQEADPWPVRWAPGDPVRYDWRYDSSEETAQALDGEAQTSKSMVALCSLRGSVQGENGGGVTLRIVFERVRVELQTPFGEMVYDSEDDGDPDPEHAGARMLGQGLVGLEVRVEIDADGRLREIRGNERFDTPRTIDDKLGAVLASDNVLGPSWFPCFAIGRDAESRGGAMAFPLIDVGPAALVVDTLVREGAGGPAFESRGDVRAVVAPGAPEPDGGMQLGPGSVEGHAEVEEGRLVASEVTRRLSFGVDVSGFTGRDGDMAWRRYEHTSTLRSAAEAGASGPTGAGG